MIPVPSRFSDEQKAPSIFSLSLLEEICLKGPNLNERGHIRTLFCSLTLQQLIHAQSPARAGQETTACRTFLFSHVPHSTWQSVTLIMNREYMSTSLPHSVCQVSALQPTTNTSCPCWLLYSVWKIGIETVNPAQKWSQLLSERERNLDLKGVDFKSLKMIIKYLSHSKGGSDVTCLKS